MDKKILERFGEIKHLHSKFGKAVDVLLKEFDVGRQTLITLLLPHWNQWQKNIDKVFGVSTIPNSGYYEYLKSEEWLELRQRVLSRDNHLCQECGSKAQDIHHLTYKHFRHEPLEDLVSLCRRCHIKADDNRKTALS